ncbi:uncharacterized protein METZ01_LOCUS422627 [marine metagenome]|uniref:Uncharacterized protein n=1 Tax=marine metagenome TaxID=408172 RepID=A0A382XFL4_9ZZZZ
MGIIACRVKGMRHEVAWAEFGVLEQEKGF